MKKFFGKLNFSILNGKYLFSIGDFADTGSCQTRPLHCLGTISGLGRDGLGSRAGPGPGGMERWLPWKIHTECR